MGDLPSRSERRLELAHRLNVMRIGGPTADGRSHLGGSMSMEDWIDLQEVLTADLVELPVKGSSCWGWGGCVTAEVRPLSSEVEDLAVLSDAAGTLAELVRHVRWLYQVAERTPETQAAADALGRAGVELAIAERRLRELP